MLISSRFDLPVALLLAASFTASVSHAAVGSWSTSGPPDELVEALALDPVAGGVIYAGTNNHGVFKSSDQGVSWSAVNNGLTGALNVTSLAIDPSTPATVYKGGGLGVRKSTNGGASWTAVNNGLTDTSVYSLAIDPTQPATLYAGVSGAGVYKSTDGGANWVSSSVGLAGSNFVNALAIRPDNPAILYAGDLCDGFYISTNGGAGWTPSNSGLFDTCVTAIAIDPSNPNRILAGTFSRVARSINGGATWTGVYFTGGGSDTVRAVAFDRNDPSIAYAGTWLGGVLRSLDHGLTWSAYNTGLTNLTAISLASSPGFALYAGTANGVYGIHAATLFGDGFESGDLTRWSTAVPLAFE